MSKTIKNIIGVSLTAALTLLAVGCATTPQNQAITSAAITTLTAVGATEYIIQNPNTRPDFVAADAVVTALATTNTVTVAQIESGLSSIKLGNNQAAVTIAIADVLPLLQLYTQQPSTNAALSSVQLGAQALVAGLNQALAATVPANGAGPVLLQSVVAPK